METKRHIRLIGNRAFYQMVLAVVLPIIIQNAITNFVSLLDNLMVGQVGTEQMTGVAVANQLLFVYNLAIFGAVAGAGIFTAQYHGAANLDGVRATFRYKLYVSLLLSVAALALFLAAGRNLVSLYLNDTNDPNRVQITLDYGVRYLRIMLLGIVPFALTQTYAGTLRETGETALPMRAGIAAVLVNLLFNYLLIFGNWGFPRLGVDGAAIATVISRYVELAIIIFCTHRRHDRFPWVKGIFRTLKIPLHLVRSFTLKGMPLLANELFWSMGIAILTRIYSLRGLDVVAAMNISNTISNLFNVVLLAMGNATAIIVGQALGASKVETAKDYAWSMLFLSVISSLAVAVVLALLSGAIPMLYNTSDAVHSLATRFILVCAGIMPISAFVTCTYFIMRSGGKTVITFLFDCVFCWAVCIPIAFLLAKFTDMRVTQIYLFVQLTEVLKAFIGLILIQKGFWIHNIVSGNLREG